MKAIILIAITILNASANASDSVGKKEIGLVEFSTAAQEIEDKASQDLRQEVDRSKDEFKQLNSIGMISVDGKKYDGAGFLVSPCHVLTNVHVTFDKYEEKRNGKRVYFSVGQNESASAPFLKNHIAGAIVAHGNYDGTAGTTNSDWVLIKLSEKVGNELGFIKIIQMSSEHMANRQVITSGFPLIVKNVAQTFDKMYGDLDCKVIGMGAFGNITHTCQTTGGQSGGPILAMNPKDGKYYAIGMVSGGSEGSSGLNKTEDPNLANTAVSFESGKPYHIESDGDSIVASKDHYTCD